MPDSFLRPASPPSYTRAANSPYFQIALYAGGNVLAVGICLLLWFCWDVLSAFEEPLLWAWLCSLSLRDIKRYLVTTARRELRSRYGYTGSPASAVATWSFSDQTLQGLRTLSILCLTYYCPQAYRLRQASVGLQCAAGLLHGTIWPHCLSGPNVSFL